MVLWSAGDKFAGMGLVPDGVEAAVGAERCAPFDNLLGAAKFFLARMVFRRLAKGHKIDEKIAYLRENLIAVSDRNPFHIRYMFDAASRRFGARAAPRHANLTPAPHGADDIASVAIEDGAVAIMGQH